MKTWLNQPSKNSTSAILSPLPRWIKERPGFIGTCLFFSPFDSHFGHSVTQANGNKRTLSLFYWKKPKKGGFARLARGLLLYEASSRTDVLRFQPQGILL
jgi:hypothetical protein